MDVIAGWPHWQIEFDKSGHVDAAARAALLDQIPSEDLTDLIVMSHGWNNSPGRARLLYESWFAMLPLLLPAGSPARLGTVGVIWPSMLWPDESLPVAEDASPGGAAGLAEPAGPAGSAGALVAELRDIYQDPDQQQIIGQLATLLDAQSPEPQALAEFHALMRALDATEAHAVDPEESGPLKMLDEDPQTLAARFAATRDKAERRTGGMAATSRATQPFDEGGAASVRDFAVADTSDSFEAAAGGIGDITGRLWNGAKEALRQFTYWQMKQRAGTIGQHGLGPFLGDLASRAPDLRVHLIGHSFGARLVSFSLAGLPDGMPSPICSVTLLEGAFSHFAFAPSLPHDPARSGALNGMMSRVNGPLLACYSSHDMAVGLFYPVASMTANEDAAGLADELMFRWGGVGHDGAQAVEAMEVPLQPTRTRYDFDPGRFTNIDSSDVVRSGAPPSGAHSDIVHPELGWAMLTAAGLV